MQTLNFHLYDEDVISLGESKAVEDDVLVHVDHLQRNLARVEGFGDQAFLQVSLDLIQIVGRVLE
jgi:hypothetical protein